MTLLWVLFSAIPCDASNGARRTKERSITERDEETEGVSLDDETPPRNETPPRSSVKPKYGIPAHMKKKGISEAQNFDQLNLVKNRLGARGLEGDLRWNVPSEEDRCCESGYDMCCRCVCSGFVGGGTADRLYIRGAVRAVRKASLEALRNLVELDWYLVHEPAVLAQSKVPMQRRVPEKYLDGLYDKVISVIERQYASTIASLVVLEESFADRMQEILLLDSLHQVELNLLELVTYKEGHSGITYQEVTYKTWLEKSFHSKNTLRFIGDRMTHRLNEHQVWRWLTRLFNCMDTRDVVTVELCTAAQPGTLALGTRV